MPGSLPAEFWDSSTWLAWITGEQRDSDSIDGIEEHAQLLENKKIHIISSVLAVTEVLEANVGKDVKEMFTAQFQRSNCELVDVNQRIATLASEIRSYYKLQQATDGLPTVETPDAIHVATAILSGCERIWTFDKKSSKSPSRPNRSMISLNGMVAGQYKIIIELPFASEDYKAAKLKRLLDASQLSLEGLGDEETE